MVPWVLLKNLINKTQNCSWLLAIVSIFLFVCPTVVLAFGFDISSTDESFKKLGELFGNVTIGTRNIVGPDNSLGPNHVISELFRIFNTIVFSVGGAIVAYSAFVSVMNTAQEGEIMGKRWSSFWIPTRGILGVLLLIPWKYYSLIQILILTIIIQGVGAGNLVWNEVLSFAQNRGAISSEIVLDVSQTPPKVNEHLLNDSIASAIQSIMCMDEQNQIKINNDEPDRVSIKRSIVGNHVIVGFGSSGTECGKFGVPSPPSGNTRSLIEWKKTQLRAIEVALQTLEHPFDQNNVLRAKARMVLTILDYYRPKTYNAKQEVKAALDRARREGWLYAGSYYFRLTDHEGHHIADAPAEVNYNSPIFTTSPSFTQNTNKFSAQAMAYSNAAVLDQSSLRPSNYNAAAQQQIQDIEDLQKQRKEKCDNFDKNIQSMSFKVPFDELSNTLGTFPALNFMGKGLDFLLFEPLGWLFDKMFSFIKDGFEDLKGYVMCQILTEQDDPLHSMLSVGKTILTVTDSIFFNMVLIVGIMFLGSCVGTIFSPICFVLGGLLTVMAPIFAVFIIGLYTAGLMFAVYNPMIPFIVFTFTSLGWFALCIEAVVAAPIVALGVVSPAQDAIGKAAPSIPIITNIFIRPSLMIVGLATAATLLKVVADILLETFNLTINSAVGSYGIFPMLAIICLFAAITTALYHKVFSLIYLLPDRIVRWIGGQVEHSPAEEALQEAKKGLQDGAKTGAKLAQSALGAVGEGGYHAAKKAYTDMGEGFGFGGKSSHSERGRRKGYKFNKEGKSVLPEGKKEQDADYKQPGGGWFADKYERIKNTVDLLRGKSIVTHEGSGQHKKPDDDTEDDSSSDDDFTPPGSPRKGPGGRGGAGGIKPTNMRGKTPDDMKDPDLLMANIAGGKNVLYGEGEESDSSDPILQVPDQSAAPEYKLSANQSAKTDVGDAFDQMFPYESKLLEAMKSLKKQKGNELEQGFGSQKYSATDPMDKMREITDEIESTATDPIDKVRKVTDDIKSTASDVSSSAQNLAENLYDKSSTKHLINDADEYLSNAQDVATDVSKEVDSKVDKTLEQTINDENVVERVSRTSQENSSGVIERVSENISPTESDPTLQSSLDQQGKSTVSDQPDTNLASEQDKAIDTPSWQGQKVEQTQNFGAKSSAHESPLDEYETQPTDKSQSLEDILPTSDEDIINTIVGSDKNLSEEHKKSIKEAVNVYGQIMGHEEDKVIESIVKDEIPGAEYLIDGDESNIAEMIIQDQVEGAIEDSVSELFTDNTKHKASGISAKPEAIKEQEEYTTEVDSLSTRLLKVYESLEKKEEERKDDFTSILKEARKEQGLDDEDDDDSGGGLLANLGGIKTDIKSVGSKINRSKLNSKSKNLFGRHLNDLNKIASSLEKFSDSKKSESSSSQEIQQEEKPQPQEAGGGYASMGDYKKADQEPKKRSKRKSSTSKFKGSQKDGDEDDNNSDKWGF